MTRNPAEQLMVHFWNRVWCGGRHGEAPVADQVIFVGELEDVLDRAFGLGLPNRREHARRYYEFVGYILGFDPAAYDERAALRASLGYDERPLIVTGSRTTALVPGRSSRAARVGSRVP